MTHLALDRTRSTVTGRTVATSFLTTNTKVPVWLTCTATDGNDDRVFDAERHLRRHQRSRPQHLVGCSASSHGSSPCRLPISTVFSIIVTWPLAGFVAPGMKASTVAVSASDRLANVLQRALRHREGDVDRRHLDDGRERSDVGLAHEIADLHVGHAGSPADRRADVAEAELNLQIFQRRLVGFRSRPRDIDLGLRVVERDQRGGVAGHELGVARDVAQRLLELRLGAGDHRLDALDLRLDLSAVEGEQEVALADHGAVRGNAPRRSRFRDAP